MVGDSLFALKKNAPFDRRICRRAGNGTRTRDTLLGKQVLYQLSYTRSLPKL